jgi:SprT protein
MKKDDIRHALRNHIPRKALENCVNLIIRYKIDFRVTPSRHSKYGDYQAPHRGSGHKITVNDDLNKYAFLITFIHEVAHLTTWNKHRRVKFPHGLHWKNEFSRLMQHHLKTDVFPRVIVEALHRYLMNPAATSCCDIQLQKALQLYDKPKRGWKLLEDIEYNIPFLIGNGRIFIKRRQLIKNFECTEMHKRHIYLINPLMQVRPLRSDRMLRKAG